MSVFEDLRWRGLVYDATEQLPELLDQSSVAVYSGFDPTASSLHAGSLLPALTLARLQRAGHRPIAVVGGGTGMIGDPSGKSQERLLLTAEQVLINAEGIRAQLAQVLDFDRSSNPARLVNNAEWLATVDLLGFLRDTGKHFTINSLLQKESISRRLESEDGISFTEFSYLLLQARDYLELFDRFGCTLQLGGSDQWGNITAGIDLIRRVRSVRVHGLVTPLLTTASGAKFGKTEAGAVWLDRGRTSPYAFYQFWFNTDDRDVISHVKRFTFLDRTTIDGLEREAHEAPERRLPQRALAHEMTTLIHGSDQVARVERAVSLLFSEDLTQLGVDDVLAIFSDVPSAILPREKFVGDGFNVVELLALPEVAVATSKAEARRLVLSGGIYVNNRRISDPHVKLGLQNAIEGQLFVVRKGQKQNHLVRLA
jgi:tyrosyl-tRNA synthetase